MAPLRALTPYVGGYVLTDEGRKKVKAQELPAEFVETIEAVDVRLEDGKLVFDPIGQPNVPLYASGPGELFTKQAFLTVGVDLGENGKAKAAQGLTVKQGPREVEYGRDGKAAKKLRKALEKKRKAEDKAKSKKKKKSKGTKT